MVIYTFLETVYQIIFAKLFEQLAVNSQTSVINFLIALNESHLFAALLFFLCTALMIYSGFCISLLPKVRTTLER